MFIGLIDAFDFAARVSMRMQGIVHRRRIGRTFFGMRMRTDIRDFIQRRIYFFGIYEPNLTHYIVRRLKSGDRFVDIGANVGYITLLASSIVGERGDVYAVEACPSTLDQLDANVALNRCSNVRTLGAAVTGERCRVEVVLGERHNLGSNSVRPASESTGHSVLGLPFESLPGLKFRDISFIKIDIEGAEFPVLRDILAHLGELRSLHTLVAEISPGSAELVGSMIEAGFTAYALPNNYRIGYTLVRKYLARSCEEKFVTTIPVKAYSVRFTDYVFERSPGLLEREYAADAQALANGAETVA